MKTFAKLMTVVVLLVLAGMPAFADTKEVKKTAKEMLKGKTVYMKINAPSQLARHPYGVYHKALVEVSPDGVNTAQGNVEFGYWHSSAASWEVRINDMVEVDDFDFDDGDIKIDLEGTGKASGNDTAIKFVRVNSAEDFKKAFDHAFSEMPLQDEYDWPEEIKKAIANHQLIDGMTKRQAYLVTGDPVSFDKEEGDGVEVETWVLVSAYGLPPSIKFTDGKLSAMKASSGVNLDD